MARRRLSIPIVSRRPPPGAVPVAVHPEHGAKGAAQHQEGADRAPLTPNADHRAPLTPNADHRELAIWQISDARGQAAAGGKLQVLTPSGRLVANCKS